MGLERREKGERTKIKGKKDLPIGTADNDCVFLPSDARKRDTKLNYNSNLVIMNYALKDNICGPFELHCAERTGRLATISFSAIALLLKDEKAHIQL